MNEPIPISLFQLTNLIKKTLQENLSGPYWIIAEIAEIMINVNGHCYIELVEKEEEGVIISKAKATIWAYTFRILKPYFETTTGQSLSQGMKVLVKVYIEFHELYGLSLNIQDIEPSYTIGEIEKKRQVTIDKLKKEGVIDMNKDLELPVVIQNIAIISSQTAAGYEDFINQTENNNYGYHYNCKLFPAIMQGKEAVDSIIKALNQIFLYENKFHIVIIIRGGGSQLDLNCYDEYLLAYNIAQFPLPVITGIGHTKDNTVTDMVAHLSLKTPTAVAEYLISHNAAYEQRIEEIVTELIDIMHNVIENQNNYINTIGHEIHYKTLNKLSKINEKLTLTIHKIENGFFNEINRKKNKLSEISNILSRKAKIYNNDEWNRIKTVQNQLKLSLKILWDKHHQKLEKYKHSIELLDPVNVLERGYTITQKQGKIIKSVKQIDIEDEIETHFKDGKINSRIVSKK